MKSNNRCLLSCFECLVITTRTSVYRVVNSLQIEMMNQIDGSCLSNSDPQSGLLLIQLINHLLASQCLLKDVNLYPPDKSSEIEDEDHFDFIVIGAGSAGSVVTNTLTNNGKWKILVIEAGGYPEITTEVSYVYRKMFSITVFNYSRFP